MLVEPPLKSNTFVELQLTTHDTGHTIRLIPLDYLCCRASILLLYKQEYLSLSPLPSDLGESSCRSLSCECKLLEKSRGNKRQEVSRNESKAALDYSSTFTMNNIVCSTAPLTTNRDTGSRLAINRWIIFYRKGCVPSCFSVSV